MRFMIPLTLVFAAILTPPGARAQDEAKFVTLMDQYLGLANHVVDTAGRKEATIFLAIEGIFEVYEQRRDAPGAVKHLERLLQDNGSNQTVRNLIRFKLRDIYKETGQADRALEQLDLLIAENS